MKAKYISPSRFALVLMVALLVLGQLQRVELPGMPALYLHEVVIALLGVSAWWNKKEKLRIPLPVGVFITVLALSLAVNSMVLGSQIVGAGLYFVRLLLYGSLIVSAGSFFAKDSKFVESALCMIIMGLSIGGILQYVFLPDTRALFQFGWDKHLYRAIGTLYDPNFLGLMMVLGTLFLFKHKTLFPYSLILVLICLALTYSRASYISLAIVGLVAGIRAKKWREIALAVVIGMSVVSLLPQRGGEGNLLLRSASLGRRMDSNQRAIEVIKENPLFGIGFNAYKKESLATVHPSSPDNSFLLILATSGIIGGLAFAYLCFWVIKTYQADTVLMSSLLAVGIHAMFNNSLFYPWVMVWLALLFAKSKVTERKLL